MLFHDMKEEDTSAYLNITSLCGPGGWQVIHTYLSKPHMGIYVSGMGHRTEGLWPMLPGCCNHPTCTNHSSCCICLLPWISGQHSLSSSTQSVTIYLLSWFSGEPVVPTDKSTEVIALECLNIDNDDENEPLLIMTNLLSQIHLSDTQLSHPRPNHPTHRLQSSLVH